MTDLEKSILKTLAFFDVFSYPLTAEEIFKWLYKPNEKYSLLDVKQALKESKLLYNKLSLVEAFYSLKGREHIAYLRKKNNNIAERKFYKAIRLIKMYRLVPFVRMVAICNTLAYSNAREDSDIDLFIIAKKGKIWLARFFTILLVKLLGKRPEYENNRDTFCLSFFIDEEHLNIENININSKDIYTPYWVAQLMPVYDPDGLYAKFIEENKWYLKHLPNAYPNQFSKAVKETKLCKFWEKIIGNIFSPPWINYWLDPLYRRFQYTIIDHNMKSLVNVDTRVIVNERMLKFHSNDRREIFYRAWQNRVHKILDKYEKKSSSQIV